MYDSKPKNCDDKLVTIHTKNRLFETTKHRWFQGSKEEFLEWFDKFPFPPLLAFSGTGSQEVSFWVGERLKHTFYGSFNKPFGENSVSRQNCSFARIVDYERLLDRLKPEDRTFWETLKNKVRLHFDIDGEGDTYFPDPVVIDELENKLIDFGTTLEPPIRFHKKDFRITTSSKDKKLSLHITIIGRFFPSNMVCGLFYKQFVDWLEPDNFLRRIMDSSAYTTNRKMRGIYNTKPRQNRPLNFYGENTYPFTDYHPSYVEGEEPYDFIYTIPEKDIPTGLPEIVGKDDLHKLLKLIIEQLDTGKHSLITDRLHYENWYLLAQASTNSGLTEDDFDSLIVPLYYRPEDVKDHYRTLSSGKRTKPLTIRSLYKWALENAKFRQVFPRKYCAEVGRHFTLQTEYWKEKGLEVEVYNERYVKELTGFQKKGLIILSALGTGKTKQLVDAIKKMSLTSVLVLSPRRLFAISITSRLQRDNLDFVCYLDCDFKPETDTKIVIQVESLNKVGNRKFDLVVIDEVEAVLNQLLSKDTHRNLLELNSVVFSSLITKCDNFVAMDGYVSNRTISVLNKIGIELTDMKLIKNTYQPTKRSSVLYSKPSKTDKEDKFLKHLEEDIKKGKNIWFLSSSRDKIETEIKPLCQNTESIFYTSTSSQEEKKTLENVDVSWKKCQVVGSTTSISVGINFSKEHFDRAYAYVSPNGGFVRDYFQNLMRVRHLKTNQVRFKINDRYVGETPPIDLDQIRRKINYDDKKLRELIPNDWDKLPEWIQENYIFYLQEKALNKVKFREVIDWFLINSGYAPFEDYNEVGEIMEKKKVIKASYEDIKLLTENDYYNLKKRAIVDGLTEEELNQISKYKFHTHIKTDYDKEQLIEAYKVWIDKPHIIRNIHLEMNYEPQDAIDMERLKHNNTLLIDKKGLRLNYFQQKILHNLGLEHSWDDKVWTKEELDKLKLTDKQIKDINLALGRSIKLSHQREIERNDKRQKPIPVEDIYKMAEKDIIAKEGSVKVINQLLETYGVKIKQNRSNKARGSFFLKHKMDYKMFDTTDRRPHQTLEEKRKECITNFLDEISGKDRFYSNQNIYELYLEYHKEWNYHFQVLIKKNFLKELENYDYIAREKKQWRENGKMKVERGFRFKKERNHTNLL